MNTITNKPLAFSNSYKTNLNEGILVIQSDSDASLKCSLQSEKLIILEDNAKEEKRNLLLLALEHLFGTNPELKSIEVEHDSSEYPFNVLGTKIERSDFFQVPLLWTLPKLPYLKPERWTETKGVTHPVRDRLPDEVFYKRFIHAIGKNLTLRLLQETDLDIFHEWHNQPRVSEFWELNQSKEELLQYIRNGRKDPHQFPVMILLDNEPVGYYEFYWVKEDRLGPYYDSEAFDRGFHFLIGNTKFLGYTNTDSIIKTVLHFLFLDDPRTRKVMAEPRHDNQKVLKYAEASKGWKKLKEFDFPHKRAALLECRRELFFGGNAL